MIRIGRIGAFVTVAALVAGAAGPTTRAATLIVGQGPEATHSTIQSAIDAAIPGVDEVVVRCGTYAENLVMRDGVPVRGEDPRCTVIDGTRSGVVVSFTAAGPQTVLEGFTIVNGKSHRGGGILVDGGKPVITRNVIRDNGTPLLDGFYDYGGGIYVSSGGFDPDTAPTISYNVIRDNGAFSGGGLALVDVADAVVTSNLISGNTGSFGGGVHAALGSLSLVNNTLAGNQADYGGGLWGDTIDVRITNNVFDSNTAYLTAGDLYIVGPGSAAFEANDTFGNVPYEAYGGPFPGPGNLSADPRFVDRDPRTLGGFQPRSDSPLVDAASTVAAPARDLRGIPRTVDGDADGTGLADIGARENEGLTRLAYDGAMFVWDAGSHAPPLYNVYRGDLATLRATGVYTQDPQAVDGARHFCGLPAPMLDDAEVPDSGSAFFYLPVADGVVEGTLGFDGSRVERLKTLACQPG